MTLAERLGGAARFWEPGRLAYNALLGLAVLIPAFLTAGEPEAQGFWLRAAPYIIGLGIVANGLYCAAYPADLLLQISPLRGMMRPLRYTLWAGGALLSMALAAVSLMMLLIGVNGFSPGD